MMADLYYVAIERLKGSLKKSQTEREDNEVGRRLTEASNQSQLQVCFDSSTVPYRSIQ
jgi:hypothetical protein